MLQSVFVFLLTFSRHFLYVSLHTIYVMPDIGNKTARCGVKISVLSKKKFINTTTANINKRPMDHIAHLRKQFKSINTYDYIITWIKRRKKHPFLPYENLLVLHLNKLESPSSKDALCKVWLKLAQQFLRRRFLKVVMYFHYFAIISLLGKGMALYLYKLESPSPKDALCQVQLILAQWFWRRRFL